MIKGGPKIINDGLVLCLDAHDAKSYAGEPTTNVIKNTATWWGDGGNQTIGSKGAVAITDENLKYNGYDTVLWTPGTGQNCYLAGNDDIPTSETSTEWTWSCYIKSLDGGPLSVVNNNTLGVYFYKNGESFPSESGTSIGVHVGDGWYRFVYSKSLASSYINLAGFYSLRSNLKFYLSGWQLEKKQYATPYTAPSSPRSATNGWVDRSGNSNNGTLTNMIGTEVSHYRDGQVIMPVANSYLDFDGSDDRIQISHSTQLNNAKSWEIWFKIDSFPDTSTYDSVFSKTANWNQQGGILLSLIYGNLRFSYGGYWADLAIESISNMNTNTWYQVVGTGEDTGSGILMKGYLNGVYKGSLTSTAAFVPTNTNALYLGFGSGGTMNGQIAIFRVYEQTLTAADVLSNYNATKGRF